MRRPVRLGVSDGLSDGLVTRARGCRDCHESRPKDRIGRTLIGFPDLPEKWNSHPSESPAGRRPHHDTAANCPSRKPSSCETCETKNLFTNSCETENYETLRILRLRKKYLRNLAKLAAGGVFAKLMTRIAKHGETLRKTNCEIAKIAKIEKLSSLSTAKL